MHNLSPIDGPNKIDWGHTSADYSQWRPSYPPELFDRLARAGVGLPGQRILDLGAGVGFLAEEFTRRGSCVVGVDISPGQIDQARQRAAEQQLDIDYTVAPAEETGFGDGTFDAVTAGQCWLYFDKARAIAEVHRVLRTNGLLATCHFCWLPRLDDIARATEELVLQFNPNWTAADWSGEIPHTPAWSVGHFEHVETIVFDHPTPFTREQWRGRIRACRGVGAALSPERVEEFDRAHQQLLAETVPEQFTVLHRVDAHVLRALN